MRKHSHGSVKYHTDVSGKLKWLNYVFSDQNGMVVETATGCVSNIGKEVPF